METVLKKKEEWEGGVIFPTRYKEREQIKEAQKEIYVWKAHIKMDCSIRKEWIL